MTDNRKLRIIINSIHWVNWLIVIGFNVSAIFIFNSPNWYPCLKIGLVVQMILFLFSLLYRIKLNINWLVNNIVLLALNIWFSLEAGDIISTRIMQGEGGMGILIMFVLVSNLMFFITIKFIKEERTKLTSQA